jgi:hypothetical protein
VAQEATQTGGGASTQPLGSSFDANNALVSRPLFDQTRRPAAQSVTEASAPMPSAGGPPPRLTGILIVGGRKTAIFQADQNEKPVSVEEGGQIGGFSVTAIAPTGVVVLDSGGETHLQPSFSAAGPADDTNLPGPPQPPQNSPILPPNMLLFKPAPPQIGRQVR